MKKEWNRVNFKCNYGVIASIKRFQIGPEFSGLALGVLTSSENRGRKFFSEK
jgi:hypothetical protein